MVIPAGGRIVEHSLYPHHLARHALGLIQAAARDDGAKVEVEIYQKEVDADKNGTIEKDRETLDTDGNGKVHEMEVWGFFIRNLDYLSKQGVLDVLVSMRAQLQGDSSRPLPPGSERFKTYQALFTKASQNQDPEIRAAAQSGLKVLDPRKAPATGIKIEEATIDDISRLPEAEAIKVTAEIAEQVGIYKSAKHATLLGQLAVTNFKYVKDLKDVLIKASQSDTPNLRRAAMDAMKIFLVMEQGYCQANPGEKPKTDLPYVLLPAPEDLQMCLERPNLHEGYIEVPLAEITEKKTGETRIAIIDGDTIRVILKGEVAGVRFKGANTTEFGKGPNLVSRLGGAEPGAIKAWEELNGLLKLADYKVYVRPERLDHYGRFVSQVFVKAPGGKFIDVEAFLISRGLGMAYFVQVTDPQAYSCFLELQKKAQLSRMGLWSLLEFRDRNDPEGKRLKILHITSFHPKGAAEKGVEEPLYNEYFRLVNISGQPINLMDYRIYNKRADKYVELPYFIVPPGRTMKIASGDIATNADPNDPEKDLVLSLLFKEPFWENQEKHGEGTCLIIQDLEGRTIDSAAKYGYAGCGQ